MKTKSSARQLDLPLNREAVPVPTDKQPELRQLLADLLLSAAHPMPTEEDGSSSR